MINHVSVQRESVNQKVTDFSSIVTSIPSDTNVVFLPWQVAANGQLFAQSSHHANHHGAQRA